jgi:hypothetical protein
MVGVEFIDLVQDWDRWWALMKAVMDFWVTYNAENSLTSFTQGRIYREANET